MTSASASDAFAVTQTPFGTAPDGSTVELFVVRAGEVELRVMSYGCIIVEIRAPDRSGHVDNIVLGHDSLDGYLGGSPYFGAIVGRYANRIARGCFSLDGIRYQLATNDGKHHLHGGSRGFDKVNWSGTVVRDPLGAGVAFRHTSVDGDEGYPGTVQVEVRYMLTADGGLIIDYAATTDRETVINLSHHSYFNLGGVATPDVLAHRLTVHADQFTPVDAALIPTGAFAAVADTPFDFRTSTAVGARIADPHEQLSNAGGYDHNFVLRAGTVDGGLAHAASVIEPVTGRALHVHTTEPGLQLYTGNRLDGTIRGAGGVRYGHRSGLCLETQHFPDSPNQPGFPSVVLRPGERYASRTVYTFSIQP